MIKDIISSDPYAVISLGGKIIGKTKTIMRTLSPTWNETFSIPILHCKTPLRISIYDFDFANTDDQLGQVEIDMTKLKLNEQNSLKVDVISDKATKSTKGTLLLSICINVSICFSNVCFMP